MRIIIEQYYCLHTAGGEALLEITCPSYFVREANAAIDKEPTKYNVITSDTFK